MNNLQTYSKYTLVGVQLTGLLLSLFIVALTFVNAQQIEERVQKFVIAKVQSKIDAVWEEGSEQSSRAGRIAKLKNLAKKFGLEADALKVQKDKVVSILLAKDLSSRCKKHCSFWKPLAAAKNNEFLEKIRNRKIGQTTLGEFALDKYEKTVAGLVADLRHFGLVNAVALSLLMGLLIFHNRLSWRFAAFSVSVTAYTAWAVYNYVFSQNWAHSILFHDWAAPGYQAAMIIVSSMLFDWLFLHGVITDTILRLIDLLISSCTPG